MTNLPESRIKHVRISGTDWHGVAAARADSADEGFESEIPQFGGKLVRVRSMAMTLLAAAVFLFGAILEVTGCAIVSLARRLAQRA